MAANRVLVIDDEYGVRTGIRQILEMEGYDVTEADTGRAALKALDEQTFDVALIDYQLPDLDGLSILRHIRGRNLELMTCMITAYANIDTAIAATRQGIDFFLPKPFSPDDLMGVIETLLRHKTLKEEATRLRREHEASLLELASEKSQTRSLVSSMRDAVLVINREGNVVLVNRALVSLLQQEEGAILHRPAQEVLAGEPYAPVREHLTNPANDRTVFSLEVGDRSFMISLATFRSDEGSSLGRILTFSDISDMRRMAMEKSRFIRTMVHEFRSPLGAVKSMLEVVLDRSLGDSLPPYLDFVNRASRRIEGLVELIGDLLSLSRIDSEQRKALPAGPLELGPVVEETVDLYKERLAERQLSLELKVAPGLPKVCIEVEDLKTILTNLVGNAIKYNKDGGAVKVAAFKAGDVVRVEVTDTGLGIKAENLPRLFDEFFREKRKETRDIVGNGLGLSIVKRLAERSGGHLEVTSQEMVGSTFTLCLPA